MAHHPPGALPLVIPPTVDVVGLRVTPVAFGALFCLGAWADPIDLFGVPFGWVTRAAFVVAAVASISSAAWPGRRVRVLAFLTGMFATVSRGLTILVIGQDILPRKAELIGGSVWLIAGWLVFAIWVLTVPAATRWDQ